MALITIDGHIGAGGPDIGRRVAKMLGHEYVDRLVLPGQLASAHSSNDPAPGISERIWSFIEKAVRGVALGNAAGDPYFATAELMMVPLTWDSSPGAPMSPNIADQPDHPHSIQTLVKRGSGVLVQKAGAVALKGHEQVLKIGVFATWEDRIARVMSVQGLTKASDAEKMILEREKAQTEYFHEIHSAHPEVTSLYDLCLNTSKEQTNLAAVKITRAANDLTPATV